MKNWLRRGQERCGVRILKHDDEFVEGLSILHQNEIYGILFHQKHSNRGIRTSLLNRLTTVSELPGLLVERFGTRLVGLYTERVRFWQYAVRFRKIESDASSIEVTIELNKWLENVIRTSDNACGSWPWGRTAGIPITFPGKRSISTEKRSPPSPINICPEIEDCGFVSPTTSHRR